MNDKRIQFTKAIRDAIPVATCRDDQEAIIEACLVFAATVANAMSTQSVGFSQGHVEDALNEMLAILADTFGL